MPSFIIQPLFVHPCRTQEKSEEDRSEPERASERRKKKKGAGLRAMMRDYSKKVDNVVVQLGHVCRDDSSC